jgi:VWFA-related protein
MKCLQVWVALLVAGTVAAQVPPPRFQSGVEAVEVTLLVRDERGRPVTDLREDEITVLDKGVPQRIVAFARVSLPIRPAPVDAASAAARDVSSNDGLRESRVFVLVLDALHVSGVNVRTVRQHAREFVERHVGPNDLAAVFSPGGLEAATEDFTTDKARLLAAIDRFNASRLTSATVERDRERRAGETVLHDGKDPDDFERSRRAQALADVLQALAANVERTGGRRKALLLFSEGTDYNTGDVMGVVQRYAIDVGRDFDRAVGALMRANVALYAVDPRKLGSANDTLVESPIYNEFPAPGSISSRSVEEEYENSIRVLRDLSDLTGGFAAVDTNDVRPAFARIVEESSEYYLLAYVPPQPARPGEFRPISVSTSRRGITVVARKGYTAREPARTASVPEPSEGMPTGPAPITGIFDRRRPSTPVVAMDPPATPSRRRGVDDELALLLSSPLPKPGLPLRVQAIPFKGDGRRHVVRLLVEVLGAELQFGERRGRAEERIDLALLTVDNRGRASNGKSTAIDLSLPPEELQRVLATGVRWLSKLDLPPGRHQVRVAARAARTGATGMITHVVDVPTFERGRLSMSGVTMTSLPAGVMPTRGPVWTEKTLDTPPSAARAFVAGDQVAAAVDVYASPASGAPEVFAEVVGVEPVPRRIAADPRGVSTVFRIDTGTLKPGAYMLRVVAAAGSERVERLVSFAIVTNGDTQHFAE